jgi:hypothetical protein
VIVAFAVALPLVVIASCFVFKFGGCPQNNDTAFEQYRNNKPAIPTRFIVDNNQRPIASSLVSLWLVWFTSHHADAGIKLREYEIDRLEAGQWKDDKFLASVTFSVRPVKCSYNQWLTGNGQESQDWIRNKSLVFTIVKEDDAYKIESAE